MSTINNVQGVSGVNSNKTIQKTENNSSKTGVKKYLTAPNVVLGALATIGTLGMADVLLSRGKHINRLKGKSKNFEETVKNYEETVKNLKEKLTNLEQKCSETEMELRRSESELKKIDELIPNPEGETESLSCRVDELKRFYDRKKDGKLDDSVLMWLQDRYIDADNYPEVHKKELQKRITSFLRSKKYSLGTDISKKGWYEVRSWRSIKETKVDVPAIIDERTGKCVVQGTCFVPLNK